MIIDLLKSITIGNNENYHFSRLHTYCCIVLLIVLSLSAKDSSQLWCRGCQTGHGSSSALLEIL